MFKILDRYPVKFVTQDKPYSKKFEKNAEKPVRNRFKTGFF
jgi:hypothetical protein